MFSQELYWVMKFDYIPFEFLEVEIDIRLLDSYLFCRFNNFLISPQLNFSIFSENSHSCLS